MPSTYKLTQQAGSVLEIDESGRTWGLPASDSKYVAFLASGGVPAVADPISLVISDKLTINPTTLRTTDATPTEIYRVTIAQNTAYRSVLELVGIAEDNNNARYLQVVSLVGRAANGAAVIPARVGGAAASIVADHASGTAGSWPFPTLTASGNDVIVRVTGQVGRNIGWLLFGSAVRFTPPPPPQGDLMFTPSVAGGGNGAPVDDGWRASAARIAEGLRPRTRRRPKAVAEEP